MKFDPIHNQVMYNGNDELDFHFHDLCGWECANYFVAKNPNKDAYQNQEALPFSGHADRETEHVEFKKAKLKLTKVPFGELLVWG